ncbi:MAG: acyl-CoA thioesterase [Planctomycetales bacterium]|nr:acyl-CoA thioesterase [Planctomycetales bacterium]
MNPLVYHVVSGQAFFSGLAILLLAVYFAARSPFGNRISFLSIVVGVIAIAVSGTPLSSWWYVVLGVAIVNWLISLRLQSGKLWAQGVLVTAILVSLAVELPYHFVPSVHRLGPQSSLTILGDSVTAGMGANDASVRWPTRLLQDRQIIVNDLSEPGATVGSALQHSQLSQIPPGIVLFELGGNDILGSTTPEKFAVTLEELLVATSREDCQLVMFELPLPPFYNRFGQIQRRLARKYDVQLVPKRVFLSILGDQNATIDSIHLTPAGHQRMADTVWNLVGPTAASTPK